MALWRSGYWRGVLLRGPSGAGKSDLALRLIAGGGRLAADDRVLLWASGGRLHGRAPPALQGLVEVRGQGVFPAPSRPWVELDLVVDLVSSPQGLERVPERETVELEGVEIVRVALFPFEDSALAKLEFALQAATLGARRERAY